MKLRLVQPIIAPWRSGWRALGWPAVAAAVMLLMAAALALLVTPLWRDKQAAWAHQQLARRIAAADLARQHTAAQPAPIAWPSANARDARVAGLVEAAIRHGLVLQRADQRVRRDGDGPLAWQIVSMPASGSYSDVRAFIAEALQADEALALDALRIRRSGLDAAQVEAELTWALAFADDVQAPR